MKKLFVVLIVAALLITALAGCGTGIDNNNNDGSNNGTNNGGNNNNNGNNNGGDVTYTLTFGDTNITAASYKAGAQITQPDDPTKADNDFDGWYIDAAGNEAYTFGTMPAANLTIYAKWIPHTTYTYRLLDEYMRLSENQGISNWARQLLQQNDGYLDGYVITSVQLNGNEDIVIPSTYNNKPIYVLDKFLLSGSNVKKVTIPASIKLINTGAFKDCASLTDVVFQEDSYIVTISENSFENCSSLKEIVLPARLVDIGSKAFSGCSELTTVYVEHKIDWRNNTAPQESSWAGTNGNSDMFDKCFKLETIYVHRENGNVTINEEGTNGGVAEYKSRIGWSTYEGLIAPYPLGDLE